MYFIFFIVYDPPLEVNEGHEKPTFLWMCIVMKKYIYLNLNIINSLAVNDLIVKKNTRKYFIIACTFIRLIDK